MLVIQTILILTQKMILIEIFKHQYKLKLIIKKVLIKIKLMAYNQILRCKKKIIIKI
jgi:hypothetical protein